MIDDLKERFNLPVGLSDHTKPEDSIEILSIAHIKKVSMIEKHFTNNKKKPGNDHFHSFDKIDLKNYCKKIKYLNEILGSIKKHFLKVKNFKKKCSQKFIL